MQTAPHQNEQIGSALGILRRRLGDALLAVYLHGSAVSGGLRPQSDIDLLAVVGSGLTESQRNGLLTELLCLSGRHPAVPGGLRGLEVMVFCRSDLARGNYPARAEFVYGEWLREAFEAGESPMPERDPEYSLVLAQARQEAIALCGPPRNEVPPEVPPEHVRQAMRDALPDLLDGLHGDARNVLLTLARMTARTFKVSIENAEAVIRMPLDEVHGLRVAMHPRLAGEPESNSTKAIREAFDKALARAQIRAGRV
ncbi:DUF4111 domain-containing protein [Rhodovulum sulfidophilum]|uniref:aminoglycoside adenylyltransferase domain-containing protein n=2 Tax=Rhodovulum sulfidophilum TaxID=35806 RepID=UPI0019270BF2|nr:aminoglycoside adenylyltransferase domain-containing protein [Rhodovulum sulfidophilum]MBL3586611.1 DUF4111 domain-containing protein [Rhodovulum sulfidophilum]